MLFLIKSDNMKISVVIPTYNAEKKIKPILEKLSRLKKRKKISEIIVANDGSTDRTVEVSKKYAKIVSLKQNQGKGVAMREGVAEAKGDVIVFIDDSQFDPDDIPKMIEKMKKTKARMVIGVRDFSIIPWYRRITNVLSRFIILLGTRKKILDPISGFRAIYKKDFLSLKTQEERYSIECEINFKSLLKNMKVVHSPVSVHYSDTSVLASSSFRTWRFVFEETMFNLKTVLKIWFGLMK